MMTKMLRLVGCLALLALVASPGVLATDATDIYTPNILNLSEGQLYERGDRWPDREYKSVSLPAPGAVDLAPAFKAAGPEPGPLASIEKADFGGGSAIIGPGGGGTIYSPRQRAQRDIRKMIRDLN